MLKVLTVIVRINIMSTYLMGVEKVMRCFFGTKVFAIVVISILAVSALCTCACVTIRGNDLPINGPFYDPAQTIGMTDLDAASTEKVQYTPITTQNSMIATSVPIADVSAEVSLNNTPVVSGGDILPSATPSPTPGIGNTSAPTNTPHPDPITDMTWFDDSAAVYYDMNFDGAAERIEIVLTPQNSYTFICSVSVTVGATGDILTNTFTTELFSKALLNNYNSGDGRVELLVCCGSGTTDFGIYCYRLNSDSSALDVYYAKGWVETADENTVTIGRYLDVLGTWACTSRFSFDTDLFELCQYDSEWSVFSDEERWCTASKELLVQFYLHASTPNYAGFLYEGDRIRPLATDMSSYIRFVMDNNEEGAITVTFDPLNSTLLINGLPPAEWFSDLYFI